MRYLYSTLFYLLLPIILLRLAWRGIKNPAYCKRWQERLGFYNLAFKQNNKPIWIHAVSVGEVESVFTLIQLLQQRRPDIPILMTCTTPTGSARIQAVLKNSVVHVYLPYDIPFAVKRFLNHFKPQIAIIVETEIWLNLFQHCHKNNISLYLINARLSEKSTRGYQKIPALIKPTLKNITAILSQSQTDSERFIRIGADTNNVNTLGNIKFDVNITQDLINQGISIKNTQFNNRFVWLLASTHKDEEAQLLSLYSNLKKQIPNLLIIIAPRHVERFNEVKQLAIQNNLNLITRSSKQNCQLQTDIYLLDSMGELKLFYAASDITFVGGSLVHIGGHNILEPAVIGVPILFGQYMANFKTIADAMLKENAAVQCHDLNTIEQNVLKLYRQIDYRQNLISNAKSFITAHQGVINKIADIICAEIQ